MPVAFLDGGHISRSLFDERIHKAVSMIGIAVTMVLGWIPMMEIEMIPFNSSLIKYL